MRKLAVEYVDSSRFSVCSPEMVDALVAHGLRLDHAYSVWVIQHCWKPADDLARIKQSLKTKGNFLILNTRSRALPVSGGWMDDGIDVCDLLQSYFAKLNSFQLPPEVLSEPIGGQTFLEVFSRS